MDVSWSLVIIGGVLAFTGTCSWMWPRLVWRVHYYGVIERNEPTEMSLTWIRAQGGIGFLAGLVLIALGLLFPHVLPFK